MAFPSIVHRSHGSAADFMMCIKFFFAEKVKRRSDMTIARAQIIGEDGEAGRSVRWHLPRKKRQGLMGCRTECTFELCREGQTAEAFGDSHADSPKVRHLRWSLRFALPASLQCMPLLSSLRSMRLPWELGI